MVAAIVASTAALALWADDSGMSFWKNDNHSVTNRSGAVSVEMQCSTTFVTTPRYSVVTVAGCNLDTRPRGLIITFK